MPINILNQTVTVELGPRETETFAATGATLWELSPGAPGRVDQRGVFTAPEDIPAQRTIELSAKDQAKELGKAIITLSPPMELIPNSADLGPQEALAFRVQPGFPPVDWTIDPSNVGTVSPAGVYAAPSRFKGARSVVVTARSQLNSKHFANATVNLAYARYLIRFLVGYWMMLGIGLVLLVVLIWPGICTASKKLSVIISPPIVSLAARQSQQFTSGITGATNDAGRAVAWQTPIKGTITNGYYTAPETIDTPQSLAIQATSLADPKISGSAIVILSPDASLSVHPNDLVVRPSQTTPFFVNFGTATHRTGAVEWAVAPTDAGRISTNGLFTAPATVMHLRQATVIATSVEYPRLQAGANVTIIPGADPCPASRLLLLLVFIMGSLGSVLHALSSFVIYLGNQRFRVSWFWWYVFRPIIGGGMAVLVFFAVGGGLLTGISATGVVGIAALAGLIGMFAEHASLKLKELIETLLPVKADVRKDKADNAQST